MKMFLLLVWFVYFIGDDPDPLRFKNEIDTFKEYDVSHPPKPGCFLFIGSSSIKIWKSLKEDFMEYPVINRGFGGSHFSDVLYYFNKLVIPYQPGKIIVYEGDNDIASGKSPEAVFKDFKKFHRMILKNLDNTEIGVISAKPSPSRWHLKDQFEAFNLKIKSYCEKQDNLVYINVYKHMLNEAGRPDPELFSEDSLHMNEKGYELWREVVLPFIEK